MKACLIRGVRTVDTYFGGRGGWRQGGLDVAGYFPYSPKCYIII